jgi:hypothetical protein
MRQHSQPEGKTSLWIPRSKREDAEGDRDGDDDDAINVIIITVALE